MYYSWICHSPPILFFLVVMADSYSCFFLQLFVETQMFSVLSDSRLSTFENEHTQGLVSVGDINK